MGLLDKALHESKAGNLEKGAGLFSKALSLRKGTSSSQSKTTDAKPSARSSPGVVDDNPISATAIDFESEIKRSLDPPQAFPSNLLELHSASAAEYSERTSESPNAEEDNFPFSPEEILSLASEVERIPASADMFIADYARIAEKLPLSGLALLLPEGSGLQIVASMGFPFTSVFAPAPSADEFAASLEGDLCTSISRRLLSNLFHLPSEISPRVSILRDADSKIYAIWIYADKRLDSASSAMHSAMRALFASTGAHAASLSPKSLAIAPLSALFKPDNKMGFAVFFIYDLSALIEQLQLRISGLRPPFIAEAFRSVAETILGNSGSALALSEDRIAALLYSLTALDPELALVQFGKSLKRAMPFLGSGVFPAGRALGLDLSQEGVKELVGKFSGE